MKTSCGLSISFGRLYLRDIRLNCLVDFCRRLAASPSCRDRRRGMQLNQVDKDVREVFDSFGHVTAAFDGCCQ